MLAFTEFFNNLHQVSYLLRPLSPWWTCVGAADQLDLGALSGPAECKAPNLCRR